MIFVKFHTNSHTLDSGFYVSEEDIEFVNSKKWRLNKPDSSGNAYVLEATKRGACLHRLLMGITDSKVRIDHIDMNPLNNCRNNLRICTPSQNAANKMIQKGKKSSVYKGVFKRENGKFRVIVGKNGKILHFGTFFTETDAALEYNKRALELFGEFARLNIVKEEV
jgi:hypothetical protein